MMWLDASSRRDGMFNRDDSNTLVQEVNMLNQVDTLKPESDQSSIKINLRYFLSIKVNFKRWFFF